MIAKRSNTNSEETDSKDSMSRGRNSGVLAFWLIQTMLIILCILLAILLTLAGVYPNNDKMIEYSKWALTTLVGAFGAWIGAGAAYFFGRENLIESSMSTETALRIQRDTLQGIAKPEFIKELLLTTMNKNFMFKPTSTKKEVVNALAQSSEFNGYWWVPVLDANGALEDIIHARVFWNTSHVDNDSISKIVGDIDTDQNLKDFQALHGASFFMIADINSRIADVAARMNKSGAAVGIIVNEKGKPIYCFTKQDILNAQR